MGMFDRIRCSYPINEHFNNNMLQTKGLTNTMSEYWISPAGELYEIDECMTADFVELDDESLPPWATFQWVPNGNHGKISPCMITKYIEVYPPTWDGQWEDWPRCRIHFKYGRVVEYEHTTRQ